MNDCEAGRVRGLRRWRKERRETRVRVHPHAPGTHQVAVPHEDEDHVRLLPLHPLDRVREEASSGHRGPLRGPLARERLAHRLRQRAPLAVVRRHGEHLPPEVEQGVAAVEQAQEELRHEAGLEDKVGFGHHFRELGNGGRRKDEAGREHTQPSEDSSALLTRVS